MGICGSKVEEEETVEQVVLTIDDGKRAEAVQANSFSDSLKGPTATAAQVGRPAPPLPQKKVEQVALATRKPKEPQRKKDLFPLYRDIYL